MKSTGQYQFVLIIIGHREARDRAVKRRGNKILVAGRAVKLSGSGQAIQQAFTTQPRTFEAIARRVEGCGGSGEKLTISVFFA